LRPRIRNTFVLSSWGNSKKSPNLQPSYPGGLEFQDAAMRMTFVTNTMPLPMVQAYSLPNGMLNISYMATEPRYSARVLDSTMKEALELLSEF
jgi:hypothetical protein